MCAEGNNRHGPRPSGYWRELLCILAYLTCSGHSQLLYPAPQVSFFGRMNDVVACPRGDSCHYCLSRVFNHKYSISGLGPMWGCHYIKIALWMTRSAPFTQLGKTFTIPGLLLYELAWCEDPSKWILRQVCDRVGM